MKQADTPLRTLKQEILLQVNQRLYQQDVIPREIYEQAKGEILRL